MKADLPAWFAPLSHFFYRGSVFFDEVHHNAISEDKANVLCLVFLGYHLCQDWHAVL